MAKNENSNFSYMTRRIGGTTYKVKVVFSDTEKKTMEDKILRMIRNETVTTGGTCDIEEFPNPYNWSGYIVGQILSKPEYMGHTVNFRSHKQSYKDKNPVMNPQDGNWYRNCGKLQDAKILLAKPIPDWTFVLC